MITQEQYRSMLLRTTPPTDRPMLGPGPDRESELHDDILAFCRRKGWLVVHSRMDRRTTQQAGVSDFIIISPDWAWFVEAKRPGQKLRLEQAAFRAQVLKLGWPHAVVHNLQEFIEAIPKGKEPI